MSRRSRPFLALALPFLVFWAWAGCVLVCAVETGHDYPEQVQAASIASETGAAFDDICPETCAPVNPSVLQERQNVGARVLVHREQTTHDRCFVTSLTLTRETSIPRPPPPVSNPTSRFIQFRKLRI